MDHMQALSQQDIIEFAEAMGAVQFFPKEPGAKVEIMRVVERMVSTKGQLTWLLRTMVDRVGKWYGPTELRGVFCTKFDPADGVQAWCKETPQFTGSALEEQYIQRELESRGQAQEHYALAAGQEPRLLTGEVAEQVRDVREILPAMAASMAFPGPETEGPVSPDQVIEARLDYLKHRGEYQKRWSEAERRELAGGKA
jgi:hypothetical protein